MEFGNIADNFVGLCFVKIKSMKITKDGFDIEYTGFAYNSLIMDFVEYSEERRLFYVAITRARKHTFVMYNENMPSVFVTEMTEKDDEHQLRCPVCKKGLFKVVKEDIAKNGKKYRFFLCSNSVAGCQNSWIAFYDDEQEIFPQYQNMLQRIERERQIELSKKQEQEKRWEEFERFVEENKKRKQQMQQRIDYANTLINMKKTYKNMCIAILYMKVITNSMDSKEIISLMKDFF